MRRGPRRGLGSTPSAAAIDGTGLLQSLVQRRTRPTFLDLFAVVIVLAILGGLVISHPWYQLAVHMLLWVSSAAILLIAFGAGVCWLWRRLFRGTR
jgi:hypothetical protein